jgi:2-haloacid dehalogenase
VALTNSSESVAVARLLNAGILDHFDRVMSANSVCQLKPGPEPYRSVASAYDVDVSEVRLLAAHSWDVTGALSAGCQAAFARPARDGVEPDRPTAGQRRSRHRRCGRQIVNRDAG